MSGLRRLCVGILPYSPGFNPYQQLMADAIEAAGVAALRIPNRKWCPIQWALRQPIDLLHLDWIHSFYFGRSRLTTGLKRLAYGDALRRLKRFPLVWTAHNLVSHDSRDPETERRLVQRLIDCCDGIVTLSDAARDVLKCMYRIADRTVVRTVLHGHYIGAYQNDITPAEARGELGIAPDRRVVLFLGRNDPYKGVDDLITQFGRVAQARDMLLIAGPVGDTVWLHRLRTLVSQAVESGLDVRLDVGVVPDDKIQRYLGACDVVALPFRQILNSGSLLLAMSFARCVVAPRLGSVPEIAYPDAYFGYDPAPAGGLGEALRRSLDCPDLQGRGQAALEFARRHYGWSAAGSAMAALYREILQRR